MSLVAYGDSSSDSEADDSRQSEGGTLQQGSKSDVRKLLGVLPPPRGASKSSKQPVRIALPTLNTEDDSDDEATPNAKRVKTGSGGSGLTALLPQPKAAPRELGAGRKLVTTRSMVPYTLSKRRQDSIKSEKARAMKAKLVSAKGKQQTSGDGSDSDEEPVSFFSHLEETSPQVTSGETPISGGDSAEKTPLLSLTSVVVPQAVSAAPTQSVTATSASNSTSVSGYSTTSSATTKLPGYQTHYSRVNTSPYASATPTESTAYHPTNPTPFLPASQTTPQHSWDQHHHGQTGLASYSYTNQPYSSNAAQYYGQEGVGGANMVGSDEGTTLVEASGGVGGEDVAGGGGGGGNELVGGTGPGITIDQESLRRLAGGNMKRKGRENALNNIVDIAGDDVMDDIKVYQRHYGEDPAIAKLYKSDTSKLKAPSGEQKRKHQITWLAHEAKERELELQKHWATGAQARSTARSKYGF